MWCIFIIFFTNALCASASLQPVGYPKASKCESDEKKKTCAEELKKNGGCDMIAKDEDPSSAIPHGCEGEGCGDFIGEVCHFDEHEHEHEHGGTGGECESDEKKKTCAEEFKKNGGCDLFVEHKDPSSAIPHGCEGEGCLDFIGEVCHFGHTGAGGCYEEEGGDEIEGCDCFPACGTCGYNDHPDESEDCITCADGSQVFPVFDDGTGHCGHEHEHEHEHGDYMTWGCRECMESSEHTYCKWEDQFNNDGGCLPNVDDGNHVPCGNEAADVIVTQCEEDSEAGNIRIAKSNIQGKYRRRGVCWKYTESECLASHGECHWFVWGKHGHCY